MRKSSTTRRRSSSNPARVSTFEADERSGGRKIQHVGKSKVQSQGESMQNPRSRIRSTSSDRSSIRRSNLKAPGKTPLGQQQFAPGRVSTTTTPLHTSMTPRVSTSRLHPNLPQGARHRSPSAERASAFGTKCPRKDMRPLADRAYQSNMLAKIDSFFYNIQQSALLNTNGSLKPITLKIFVDATGCLLEFLDVKHHLAIGNYIEEIPKLAKKLRYPGTIAKSWLQTANTMHSWPQVLGWLSWLVELCEAKDLAAATFTPERLPFVGEGDVAETRRRDLLAMAERYRAWNSGKPEEEAALLEEHIRRINDQHGDVEALTEEARRDLESEKAAIRGVEGQSIEIEQEIVDRVEILEALKREEAQDIDKIKFNEETTQRGVQQIEQLNAKSDALEEQIKRGIADTAEFVNLVENQAMSVSERDAIVQRCADIRNDFVQFDNHIKDIEKELYALDMKFSRCNRNLYKAILAYNKDVIMHFDCVTGANIEEYKMPEKNLLDPEFPELLRKREAALFDLRENTKKELERVATMIKASASELAAVTDKLNTLRDKNKHRVAKVHERKLHIREIQNRAKKSETKLREQTKSLDKEIMKIRESTPDLEASDNELAEARDKQEAVLRRIEAAEAKTERFFAKFYEILGNQRSEVARLVEQLPKK